MPTTEEENYLTGLYNRINDSFDLIYVEYAAEISELYRTSESFERPAIPALVTQETPGTQYWYEDMMQWFYSRDTDIKTFSADISKYIKNFGDGLFDTLNYLIDPDVGLMHTITTEVVGAIAALGKPMADMMDGVVDLPVNLAKAIVKELKSVFDGAVAAISSVATKITDKYNTLVSSVSTALTGVQGSLTTYIGGLITSAGTTISNIVTTAKAGITSFASGVYTDITTIFTTVKEAFDKGFTALRTGLTDVSAAIRTVITKVYDAIEDGLSDLLSGAVLIFEEFKEYITELVTVDPEKIAGLITNMSLVTGASISRIGE